MGDARPRDQLLDGAGRREPERDFAGRRARRSVNLARRRDAPRAGRALERRREGLPGPAIWHHAGLGTPATPNRPINPDTRRAKQWWLERFWSRGSRRDRSVAADPHHRLATVVVA